MTGKKFFKKSYKKTFKKMSKEISMKDLLNELKTIERNNIFKVIVKSSKQRKKWGKHSRYEKKRTLKNN